MDSFFGIGLFELVLVAVIALVVLGPERLPGAMRTIADYMRQIRNVSSEFTSQFSEEIKMLEEMDPRRMINDVLDPTKTPAPAKPAQPLKTTPPAKPSAANASATAAKSAAAAGAGTTTIAANTAAKPNGEVENTILPPKAEVVAPSADPSPPAAEPESASAEPSGPAADAESEGRSSAEAEAKR